MDKVAVGDKIRLKTRVFPYHEGDIVVVDSIDVLDGITRVNCIRTDDTCRASIFYGDFDIVVEDQEELVIGNFAKFTVIDIYNRDFTFDIWIDVLDIHSVGVYLNEQEKPHYTNEGIETSHLKFKHKDTSIAVVGSVIDVLLKIEKARS